VAFLGAALAAELAGDFDEAIGRAADALHRLLRRAGDAGLRGPRLEAARLALARLADLSVTFTRED